MQEYEYHIPLMGTQLDVIFINHEEPIGLFEKIKIFGNQIETQFSRFKDTSELSKVKPQPKT